MKLSKRRRCTDEEAMKYGGSVNLTFVMIVNQIPNEISYSQSISAHLALPWGDTERGIVGLSESLQQTTS